MDINIEFQDGSTPLMRAVQNESVRLAELLLRAGAEVDRRNKYGETAFACAVRHGNVNLVTLFWRSDIDINIRAEDGQTLLMTVPRSNSSFQMLYWLVKAGADISAKDHSGRTALLHRYWSKDGLGGYFRCTRRTIGRY